MTRTNRIDIHPDAPPEVAWIHRGRIERLPWWFVAVACLVMWGFGAVSTIVLASWLS